MNLGARKENINRTPKILSLEDLDADFYLLKRYISEAFGCNGFELTNCRQLCDAVSLLRLHHYDLIITDLRLPDADGLDAVQQMRVLNPMATLIVLSGKNDPGLQHQALCLGAQVFLVKGSIDLSSLKSVIRLADEHQELAISREEGILGCCLVRDSIEFVENRFTEYLKNSESRSSSLSFGCLSLNGVSAAGSAFGNSLEENLWAAISLRLRAIDPGFQCLGKTSSETVAFALSAGLSPAELSRLGHCIVTAFKEPLLIDERRIGIHSALGCTHLTQTHTSPSEILRMTENALKVSLVKPQPQIHIEWL